MVVQNVVYVYDYANPWQKCLIWLNIWKDLQVLCSTGKDKDSGHAKFWDVVVITTADEDQKEIFDAQLKDKLDRKEVPLNLPIHIISDPPGTKLGN